MLVYIYLFISLLYTLARLSPLSNALSWVARYRSAMTDRASHQGRAGVPAVAGFLSSGIKV